MFPHWARNVWRDMVWLGGRVGVRVGEAFRRLRAMAWFGLAGEHGFPRRLRAMAWFGSQKAQTPIYTHSF